MSDEESTETPRNIPSVLTSFHWTGSKPDDQVLLCGSFTAWKDPIPMAYEPQSSVFSAHIDIPVGIHCYKFIVNGEWKYAPDQQTLVDERGNVNNFCAVTMSLPPAKVPTSPRSNDELMGPRPKWRRRLLQNQLMLKGTSSVSSINQSTAVLPRMEPALDTTMQLTVRKIILVTVGLPARGKSYISKKIARYLRWTGYNCEIFNIGKYRRDTLGSFHSHDFFRSDNPAGLAARAKMAAAALRDMFHWLTQRGGDVAIFDGTNSTNERRRYICECVAEQRNLNAEVIFLEVICNDPEIIEANIRLKQQTSPDYAGIDAHKAVQDFRERLMHYEAVYETVTDRNLSYMKIFDVGQETVTNRINGYLPSRIAFFLMNLHIQPRTIYLTRHGESTYNVQGRVGGDSELTPRGQEYARRLAAFMNGPEGPRDPSSELMMWSSTMKRAVQTCSNVVCAQYIKWKAMDEIDVGICDGMTYDEIARAYPEDASARATDKLRYRYVRGESYEDVIRRLEPTIVELERQQMPVLLVGHLGTVRCLYAYIQDLPLERVPHIDIPLHTVIKIQPGPYGDQQVTMHPLLESGASHSPPILKTSPSFIASVVPPET
eukprot:gnl/Spiro4/10217_TR5430_c0_g1_i1.p1 gnl/Spiro4/10217_TR5430_c0_g1~~gnl/Spiro4/10217_TR5430_c0_g1_i1.p1  ORF type:complete len:602 (+),score=65.35 gnl/Spiro4/10217_TR5430_c0_g1_i1:145-1950(+)